MAGLLVIAVGCIPVLEDLLDDGWMPLGPPWAVGVSLAVSARAMAFKDSPAAGRSLISSRVSGANPTTLHHPQVAPPCEKYRHMGLIRYMSVVKGGN
ncbi:hypothetical protein [Arthrobacter bambusae]|uniref:hypothetical protein n=1 Tax=Arthrobacter bambusae TaxID=1338426 RepID=UPI002783E4B8|nr:hypothetical protein [Arthrobacter bambusae]MDQ0212562.1 hypothetical protein [Arthrobacter bambusae]MDQ0236944.1 hypothetical protein [Arthrobacter bambusae]